MMTTRRTFLSVIGVTTAPLTAAFDRQELSTDLPNEIAARPSTRRGVLFDAKRYAVNRMQLAEACLPQLTKLVAELSAWNTKGAGKGWQFGDVNILIVETWLAPKKLFYVQFLSRPLVNVLNEVSSGIAHPTDTLMLGQPEADRLREFGFEIGGQVGNFTREVRIKDARDAERIAADVLSILYDVVGYRGRTSLAYEVIRDRRPRPQSQAMT